MKRKGKIEISPNLVQLTNYLAYRRKKLGDKNNIDEAIKYITSRFHYEGIDPADLFFFWIKIR